MLMPTLVRTPDQHEPMPLRTPLLKSSTETGLQVAGLQGLATDPGQVTTSSKGRPIVKCVKSVWQKFLEMRGIEPRAFHMQSERSTTELHPRVDVGEAKL